MALAYAENSVWRNRDEFFEGRGEIKAFLRRRWSRELDYRLRKELWYYQGNRISVRFEYESHDKNGQGWHSHLYPQFATRLRVVVMPAEEPEVELCLACYDDLSWSDASIRPPDDRVGERLEAGDAALDHVAILYDHRSRRPCRDHVARQQSHDP